MRKVLFAALFFMLVAVLCLAVLQAAAHTRTAARPQDPTATAQLVSVLSGLSAPLYVTSAHDGSNRLFIVEQAGRIKVLQPGATTPTIFLDISAKVLSGGEQGLLGLAFHPQFATNHRFYVDYTRRPDGATVIAEYQVTSNGNIAAATEKTLLVIPQPFANHNGGMVEFGPDGDLYIGMGDGGSGNDPGNRAQNLNELLGKILRIDVDHTSGSQGYSAPVDNPFFGSTAGRDEIYAYGLRNPWRFSFDRATGELYVADVGQSAREEVDIVRRGRNYGWRIFEGTLCSGNDAALCAVVQAEPPIAEYGHSNGRCSITGGYVYRGTRGSLPAGAYVYGDYCSGEIFLLQGSQTTLLEDTALHITSFGEDEAGEVYVVAQEGTIYRFGSDSPTPLPFTVTRALVRKRATGAVLDPISARANAKKFEMVVFESATAPVAASAGATIIVNGTELSTDYTTEGGQPVFVARLQKKLLATPGALVVEVVRSDGSRSNVLTLQVVEE
ncbi:MAG TPA: PQQ-dependent sugar dehydrogenase [Blastocatellia bacterium]|nr:PQQ-dependent sugar dehydrogenase [Blastocatellia bacterium]